jgi:hypothetical protein
LAGKSTAVTDRRYGKNHFLFLHMTTKPDAFPRGRWFTPMFPQATAAPARISTASPSGVPSDGPAGGSEQNSQPRLASEEADIRQVPSNAGAVEDFAATDSDKEAAHKGSGHGLENDRVVRKNGAGTGPNLAETPLPLRPSSPGSKGAPAGGSRPTEPAGYPLTPGSKGGESSRAAAELAARDAELTREQVLSLLLCHDFNADTLACLIRKDVHNVRSRCSELAEDGSIFFSGKYSSENNSNGIKTKVWTTRRPQLREGECSSSSSFLNNQDAK